MNGMVLESLLRLNSKYDKEPLLRLILKTALFGRCRPEHKAMVIRALRELGVICAMVGDGANDCPAIKAANLGISFAETDASISAPFSSMSPSISCIEKIMMEGKCTTQNSIEALRYYATTGMYKFIACGCLIFAESWFP
jgi:cation-transporting ATPase 13A3/4/5